MKTVSVEKRILNDLKNGQSVRVNKKDFPNIQPDEVITLCHQYDESCKARVKTRGNVIFFWKITLIPVFHPFV